MLNLNRYEALREKPKQTVVMHQCWRALSFLHFRCPASEVQAILPPGLQVDEWEDEAWIGLVPFRMEHIRLPFLPPIPGTSAFPETNVRTYVHRNGEKPGVWFFSLEAANHLACAVARTLWKLPYHEARMSVIEDDPSRNYSSIRKKGGTKCEVHTTILEKIGHAIPGSLEFFLIERYLLYAYRGGELLTGRVHHEPYMLYKARLDHAEDELVAAAGLMPKSFEHVLYSPGVDVDIYPLAAV